MNWSISAWSLKTRRSSILKYGSESDKGSISGEVSGRNRPRGKISRQRKLLDRPLYPNRQSKASNVDRSEPIPLEPQEEIQKDPTVQDHPPSSPPPPPPPPLPRPI